MTEQLSTMRITSASFSGADAVEAFRELYGRAVMRLEIDPVPEHEFELDFTIKAVPGFSIAAGRLSPTVNRHPSSLIDNDDIVLVWAADGHGSVSQFGREATIKDGSAAFASNAEVGVFRGHSLSQLVNFRFTRKMLSDMLIDVDATMARPIPSTNAALALLTGYASVMNDIDALASPELYAPVVTHMHDLAALVLGANQDGVHVASRRGMRAARLRAIQDDIKRNLSSRDLSPASIAQRHRLSTRSLRDLFQADGTSFTDYVLQERLALVRRKLLDSRFAKHSISSIALDCGFGDISYFNHAFRKRYGMTPSDARVQAWTEG